MRVHRLDSMRVFVLVIHILSVFKSVTSLSSEGWALLHFRSNIEVDPKRALSNWSAYDKDPCGWFGVSCENGRVTTLNLGGLSLRGTLSPELGQLVDLRGLVLRGNKLSGLIPCQLGELGKLEVLDLAQNQFSGSLPKDLGNLSSLSRLYLENNNFEGVIPPELGELENLCELIASVNKLIGIIPGDLFSLNANSVFDDGSMLESGMCKLKYLQVADFSCNYFEGRLPVCLQHLPSASFSLNCLSQEGLPHQRPIQECSRKPYAIVSRRLLQSDGAVTNQTVSNTTGGAPLSISTGSPAPSPSPSTTTQGANTPTPIVEAPSTEGAPSPLPGALTPPLVSTSESSSQSSSRKSTVVGVAVASIVASCVGIAAVLVWLRYRNRRSAVRPWKGTMSGELQKGFTKGVPAFSRAELEAACEDFSNIIGSSPDIVLFKGTLANGVEIAVTSIRKSAKSWSSNSELIFWRKVECLSQMKHQNLVNLLGYCAEEEPFIRMLVFEYVPNGTVHEHLHNIESEDLDWGTRMRIIMGVAYALDYMHHGSDSPVTHTKLDAKAVFLTEDFSPKVADFGIWKVSNAQKDSKASSGKYHELGHDDLELSDRLIPLLETNVHDFGVFLLEMVTGRSPFSKEVGSLVDWAWSYISPAGKAAFIVDPSLESHNVDELEVVIGMAYDCLHPDTSRALTMRQISFNLSSSLSSIKEPIIPKSSPLLWAELQILSQD